MLQAVGAYSAFKSMLHLEPDEVHVSRLCKTGRSSFQNFHFLCCISELARDALFIAASLLFPLRYSFLLNHEPMLKRPIALLLEAKSRIDEGEFAFKIKEAQHYQRK